SSSDDISSDSQILKISALSLEESSEYKGYGTYLNHVASRKICYGNRTYEKHLVIVTQYMSLNVPVIRYIYVMKLEDCRAEYIFETLKNFISNKDLNIENIASTMMVAHISECLNLKMIQETNDEPQLCLLNIINTWWLSMSNTVHNLHQILDSVKDALNHDFIYNKQDKEKAKKKLVD
ncbi:46478_t:CDS:2, partial [Gigaspora margarita]